MPTYEYECPEGHAFEKFQKITDKPRTKCPVCGKAATRKISGGAGLVFRGSGFYITDYGKDGKKDQRESAKAATAKSAGESSGAKSSGEAKSAGDAKASGGSKSDAPAKSTESAPAKPPTKAAGE